MEIKAILFDMDGVLVDSEAFMMRSAIEALAEFGVTAVPEDFTEFIGAGEDKFVGGVAEKHGKKYDLRMKDRAYEIYGEYVRKNTIAYDGVRDILLKLKEKGYRMAVCSAADRVKVNYNLESIGVTPDFFGALITGSDVERKKPFPDVYLAGANGLGVAPEQCAVVEDAINGIKAAKAAGAYAIAVTTSFSESELRAATEPDAVICDVTHIFEIL